MLFNKAGWLLLAGSATAAVLPGPSGHDARDGQLVMHPSDDLTEALHELSRVAADTWQTVKDVEHRVEQSIEQKTHQATEQLDDLSVDAWQSVQGLLGSADAERERLVSTLDDAAAEAKKRVKTTIPHPEAPIDLRKYTVGQILNWTLTHAHDGTRTLPIHKIAWVVNQTQSVQEALFDPHADLTFFAPSDEALTPPHHRHEHHGGGDDGDDGEHEASSIYAAATQQLDHPFWDAIKHLRAEGCPHHQRLGVFDDDDDDDRKEKKRRFIKAIVTAVLKYHISPKEKTVSDILDAATLPTNLTISHDKKAPVFRIRVGRPSPIPFIRTKLNFFSSLNERPILAKNGVIYILGDAPLLPPLSPLSQAFLFPQVFSTLTSAVQKVGLADSLLPHYGDKTLPLSVGGGEDDVDERVMHVLSGMVEEEKRLTKRSFTVFAPTNKAFAQLGLEINAFLFSPFGSPALRYVLKYHIVPDVVFHTDHLDNTTDEHSSLAAKRAPWHGKQDGWPGWPHHDEGDVTHYELPTLLGGGYNETLYVDVVKSHLPFDKRRVSRHLVVKPSPGAPSHLSRIGHPHPIVAFIADGVAWGGAVHVLPELIPPPIPEHHHHHKDHDLGRRHLERLVQIRQKLQQ